MLLQTQQSISSIIGNNIRFLRKKMDMSQTKLADALNLSQSYIVQIEKGRKSLKTSTIEKIAWVLETDFLNIVSKPLGDPSAITITRAPQKKTKEAQS